jgi:UDP-N-acetylmuramoyl-L-alanyl-D-glutamate--2,6-diaminopimelate ligase
VIVVFGCGGDRDRAKRPMMGRAAAEDADVVIVTNDNPRSEDPLAIIDAITSGIPDGTPTIVEPDRATAIERAIDAAEPGDVVVVAGKGHETTQEVDGMFLPFDDREVALAALARRSSV